MARGHPISAEIRAAIMNEGISGVPLKELAERYSLGFDSVKKIISRARTLDLKKVHHEKDRLLPAVEAKNAPFACSGNCEQLRLANDKIRRLQSQILSLVSVCIDA